MIKLIIAHVLLYYAVIVDAGIAKPTKASLLPNTHECGVGTHNRIYGGTLAMLSEFPWTALLQPADSEFTCGGSLIGKRYVLTAAHCMDRGPIVNVRLGEYNLSSTIDCEAAFSEDISPTCADAALDIPVENIILHEDYNNRRSVDTHDIALIRLSKEVNFTKYIKPICIPLMKLNVTSGGNQTTATVVGWGQTETAHHSNLKLKVQVPIKENPICSLPVTGSQLCVGGEEGKDSCAGDSGGPLMVQESDDVQSNWYIIGIVSYGGEKCAVKGIPSIYTNVSNYVDWINNNLEP